MEVSRGPDVYPVTPKRLRARTLRLCQRGRNPYQTVRADDPNFELQSPNRSPLSATADTIVHQMDDTDYNSHEKPSTPW